MSVTTTKDEAQARTEALKQLTSLEFVQDMLTIRARKAELNARLKSLNELEEAYEAEGLRRMEANGETSFGTPIGTAYRTHVSKVEVPDWPAFHKWIIANGLPDMLERRPSKTTIEAFIAEHNQTPPGILLIPVIYKLSVRKA